mgnify:CR=1 FL=1
MNKNLQEIGSNILPATDNLDAYIKEETEIDYSNENIKQLADSLFRKAGNEIEYIKMAYELIRDCECESGCPACIYSSQNQTDDKHLNKEGTLLILKELYETIKNSKKIV